MLYSSIHIIQVQCYSTLILLLDDATHSPLQGLLSYLFFAVFGNMIAHLLALAASLKKMKE
jgi:hypothetical protein